MAINITSEQKKELAFPYIKDRGELIVELSKAHFLPSSVKNSLDRLSNPELRCYALITAIFSAQQLDENTFKEKFSKFQKLIIPIVKEYQEKESILVDFAASIKKTKVVEQPPEELLRTIGILPPGEPQSETFSAAHNQMITIENILAGMEKQVNVALKTTFSEYEKLVFAEQTKRGEESGEKQTVVPFAAGQNASSVLDSLQQQEPE